MGVSRDAYVCQCIPRARCHRDTANIPLCFLSTFDLSLSGLNVDSCDITNISVCFFQLTGVKHQLFTLHVYELRLS